MLLENIASYFKIEGFIKPDFEWQELFRLNKESHASIVVS